MRNFQTVVKSTSTILWSADQCIDRLQMQSIMSLFNGLFGNHPRTHFSCLTPSEQLTISEFLRYARRCRNRKSNWSKDVPGSFVYINLNTGESVVFITDFGYGNTAAYGEVK